MKQFRISALVIMSVLSFAFIFQAGCAGQTKTTKAQVTASGEAAGTWKGNGSDTNGTNWDFTFTLTQNNGTLNGEGDWKGSDGSTASTTMKGSIDIAKKTFTLTEMEMNNVAGNVALVTHTGTFSADFKKMTGKWKVPNASSGTFKAVKVQ